jgi:hypothetical protein
MNQQKFDILKKQLLGDIPVCTPLTKEQRQANTISAIKRVLDESEIIYESEIENLFQNIIKSKSSRTEAEREALICIALDTDEGQQRLDDARNFKGMDAMLDAFSQFECGCGEDISSNPN